MHSLGKTLLAFALLYSVLQGQICLIIACKMGTIKDKNGMDLKEAENIKKRWQEYTEELNKKVTHDLDN